MLQKTFSFVLAITAASIVNASSLSIELLTGNTNAIVNGATFDEGPVDVYQAVLDADMQAFSFQATFLPGAGSEFINSQTTTFGNEATLPTGGPFTFGETFFIIPDGTTELGANIVDDASSLSGGFTLAGGPVFADVGETIVALLTVPAGSAAPIVDATARNLIGDASGNEFELRVGIVPEPASLALVGLGFAGMVARRRRV